MNTTRTPRAASDAVSVLLVGPNAWRERVRPTFGASDAFSTRAVETPEKAIAATTEQDASVDCIVSAQRFDANAGLELLAELRSHGVLVPFVLVPTDGSETLASEALGEGADDYVAPTADPTELRRRCRRATRRQRAHHPAEGHTTGFDGDRKRFP